MKKYKLVANKNKDTMRGLEKRPHFDAKLGNINWLF